MRILKNVPHDCFESFALASVALLVTLLVTLVVATLVGRRLGRAAARVLPGGRT